MAIADAAAAKRRFAHELNTTICAAGPADLFCAGASRFPAPSPSFLHI